MSHAYEGARAVEVTAVVGDSVVAVHHLTDPRRGRVSSATKALFAAGAVGLLVAFIAFFQGVRVADANEEALKRWTEVDKLPAVDFRARRVGVGLDLLAILGFTTGLVATAWGLARVTRERRAPRVVADGEESFAIVEPRGDAFVLRRGPGLAEEPILPGTKVRVQHGIASWLVAEVPAPGHRVGNGNAIDERVLGFAGASAVVHAALLIMMFAIPEDTTGLGLDDLGNQDRFVKVSSKPHEAPKKPEEMQKPADDAGNKGDQGNAMAGDPGKMGDPKKQGEGRFRMKKNAEQVQFTKHQAIERAKESGVLGVLRQQQGGFASITGTADFPSGLDDREVYGGLIGNEDGEASGTHGYAQFGSWYGGGGSGHDTIGTGPGYGKIGTGWNGKDGWGAKTGSGVNMRKPMSRLPTIGSPVVLADGLDKSTIRRYIRQQIAKIQYCFDKELTVKPELDGTVNVRFTIDTSGKVMAITAKGVDAQVSACVAGVIGDIQFPKPAGIVQVTSYPFYFRNPGTLAQR